MHFTIFSTFEVTWWVVLCLMNRRDVNMIITGSDCVCELRFHVFCSLLSVRVSSSMSSDQ